MPEDAMPGPGGEEGGGDGDGGEGGGEEPQPCRKGSIVFYRYKAGDWKSPAVPVSHSYEDGILRKL